MSNGVIGAGTGRTAPGQIETQTKNKMNKVTCTYKHPGYYKYSVQCGGATFTAKLEHSECGKWWGLVVYDANDDTVHHYPFDNKRWALDYLTNDFAY